MLGLLNTLVRPLLVLLTLPVTLLTLGLFLFVINALMFWAAASMLEGFNVTGFGAALIGSLIYSLCGMVIDVAIERLFAPALILQTTAPLHAFARQRVRPRRLAVALAGQFGGHRATLRLRGRAAARR